jgi:choline dehydrogenase
VTLKSARPGEHPAIVFNHLAARQDIQDLIDGVRLTRTLIEQQAWDPYRRTELTPGSDVLSDRDIGAFLRRKIGTSYHPSGTCRMGADDDAVVDTDGRLKAVSRLRVIDASIMPKVITGNLNAPVMMIAEKLADRVRGGEPLLPSTAPFYRTAS